MYKFLEWVQKNPDQHWLPEYLVVDNTNTTAWEIAPYYALALTYGWEPEIVQIDCDPHKAWHRNIHMVPEEKVLDMHDNLKQPLPGHWLVSSH